MLLGPSGDGSRTGLLSANREGVVSSVGYLAVYMAGIQLGRWLFRKRKTVAEFYSVVLFLGVGVVLLWTLTSVCEVYVQPVSRRMANLPFILWLVRNIGCRDGLCLLCKPLSKGHKNQPMLFLEPGVVSKIKQKHGSHSFFSPLQFSQVCLFLLLFLSTDLLLLRLWHTVPSSSLPSPLYTTSSSTRPTTAPPPLCMVSAVDYNQLLFFLLANLLTGLVNFSLDTLHTGPLLALAVLVGYMCVLVSLSLTLHRHRIKIKL